MENVRAGSIRLLNCAGKVTHHARRGNDLALQMQINKWMRVYLFGQAAQGCLRVCVTEGADENISQVAAQFVFLFNQMHGEALFSQQVRGSHTSRAAADDQRGALDRHFNGVLGFEQCRARRRRPNQIPGFGGRRFLII